MDDGFCSVDVKNVFKQHGKVVEVLCFIIFVFFLCCLYLLLYVFSGDAKLFIVFVAELVMEMVKVL